MKKQVSSFEIFFTQYLDASGILVGDPPPVIKDPHKLISFYQAMIKTRFFDTKAISLQRTGKLGTYPSSLGQEAVSVGIGASMQPTDVFCPYYRDLGALFWRQVSMVEILLYWGGDERGSSFTKDRNDFPLCVPIASQTLHAVGVATAFKIRRQPRVVVVVIGDGGTSRGDFYEAINLAGTWQLPIVFVINNNQWAISVPRSDQSFAKTLAQKGIAAGVESEQVDGNDIMAVYQTVHEAVNKARRGHGPALIEALTYRMGDHTTADDAKRYRSEIEVENYKLADPISRLNKYLVANALWTAEQEKTLHIDSLREVETAVQEYLNMTAEPPNAIFDNLYETLPENLISQREECLKFSGKLDHE